MGANRPKTSAERVAAYRARCKTEGRVDVTRANRKSERRAWKVRSKAKSLAFVGCDGEGAGTDELGRQNYLLFRMGERELYTGVRLTTEQILGFICDAPRNVVLVGFSFGYDVTMILRDLSEQQQRRLFEPHVFGQGHSPYVWYKNFDIDYLPKQYFKVKRVNVVRDADGKEHRIPVKGSTRTIYETFGFFQKSFLKVLTEFDIGTVEERELIRQSKEGRGGADWRVDHTERAYCALECRLLADLMERLRAFCHEADIRPRTWNGAGKLASALHTKHETPKAKEIAGAVPLAVDALANMAYYGGRFEVVRVGAIREEVFEYDICSAYPAAMQDLPCLIHGRWTQATPAAIRKHDGLYVAAVTWKPKGIKPPLGPLPVRSKEGHLYWPLNGAGVYWSCEIESAKRLGFDVDIKGGWTFHRDCDCEAFHWVEPLYNYRKSIGSSGPGYPIKLGLNSLYGKLAQRKGNGAFANMIWAGLITAQTRARLNHAISLAPQSIVMLATDAVYSLEPLELHLGDFLGAWEQSVLQELFIVQPGLYWDPTKRKRKSRGLPSKFFEEQGRTESFELAFAEWQAAENSRLDVGFPNIDVPMANFIGLRLALSRGKPETAGKWIDDSRSISFDYRNKRSGHEHSFGHVITRPIIGDANTVSLPHRDFLKAGGQEPWEAARLMLDEQPDYVDLGPPWQD